MKRELDEKLCAAFPTLFRNRHGDMRETAMCWGFDCGDGWFDLLWELCEKLEPLCVEAEKQLTPEMKRFGYSACASQVKEKYGTLRFYMTMSNDEMDALIRETERKSAKTCEICGKPGKRKNEGGWISTACKEH